MHSGLQPAELAKYLATGKATSLTHDYRNHIIIAADTFVLRGDELLGKPQTVRRAHEMLASISGQSLVVITGFTIIGTPEDRIVSEVVETKVYIRELDPAEISRYVETGEPLDKAGAFAIQGLGATIVSRIEGDYCNVIGLPLYALSIALRKFDIHIL